MANYVDVRLSRASPTFAPGWAGCWVPAWQNARMLGSPAGASLQLDFRVVLSVTVSLVKCKLSQDVQFIGFSLNCSS